MPARVRGRSTWRRWAAQTRRGGRERPRGGVPVERVLGDGSLWAVCALRRALRTCGRTMWRRRAASPRRAGRERPRTGGAAPLIGAEEVGGVGIDRSAAVLVQRVVKLYKHHEDRHRRRKRGATRGWLRRAGSDRGVGEGVAGLTGEWVPAKVSELWRRV